MPEHRLESSDTIRIPVEMLRQRFRESGYPPPEEDVESALPPPVEHHSDPGLEARCACGAVTCPA